MVWFEDRLYGNQFAVDYYSNYNLMCTKNILFAVFYYYYKQQFTITTNNITKQTWKFALFLIKGSLTQPLTWCENMSCMKTHLGSSVLIRNSPRVSVGATAVDTHLFLPRFIISGGGSGSASCTCFLCSVQNSFPLSCAQEVVCVPLRLLK